VRFVAEMNGLVVRIDDKKHHPSSFFFLLLLPSSSFFFFLLLPSSSTFAPPLLLDMTVALLDAVISGHVAEVRALLKALEGSPALNINRGGGFGPTCLHYASLKNHFEVAKLLLAHPAINVNLANTDGKTPFLFACQHGTVAMVQYMLQDPRVDVIFASHDGCTPLWWAASYGHVTVVEWLIASGKDLGGLDKKGKQKYGEEFNVIEVAARFRRTEMVALLEIFSDHPTETRREIRRHLGLLDELAAELFALTVFISDNLLQIINPALTASTTFSQDTAGGGGGATRFFTIASTLPWSCR